MPMNNYEVLKNLIRDVPNFPKKGSMFKDITPLLKDASGFKRSIDGIYAHYKYSKIDVVVCMEARGFIFGATLAYKLGAGLVIVRKKGKLPAETLGFAYETKYGKDFLEIHKDSIMKGQRVLIVDDLLATGGTSKAMIGAVEKLGGNVIGLAFLIELSFLNGRSVLKGYDVFSLLKYYDNRKPAASH
jgi:adenine phosphoribosyltransferase